MRRRPVIRPRQSRPSLLRPRGLRLEWLEDRTVPTTLNFSLDDPTLVEGESTIGTVTRSGGDLSQPLVVWLPTPNPIWATTPGMVLIPAGQASTTFPVVAVDDVVPEGDVTTNLAASADYSIPTAYALLTVLDNDPYDPIARPDGYDINEDDSFSTVPYYPGVLDNDLSPNGPLTASLVSGPSHGAFTLSPDGSFSYTPAPNFSGQDFFTYRATDSLGASGETIVTLFVWGTQDPIQLSAPASQTTAEDTPFSFGTATGNVIAISDADNSRVLVSLLANGGDGILTLPSTAGLIFPYVESVNNSPSITFYADSPAAANAALEGLVFTPAAGFNGTAQIYIMARNVGNDPNTFPYDEVYATVPVTVTPVNDAPVALDDPAPMYETNYQVYEDSTLNLSGLGVLMNDTDPDGDPLSAVLVSGPAHGSLMLNSNGGFTYTPNPNYNGADSFTYRAVDSSGLWDEATVSLTIWAADDYTQLDVPGTQTTLEDTPLTFSVSGGNAITITDPESPRLLVDLSAWGGILTLPSIAGLEFPYPNHTNNSPNITFYADNPAEANAALDGLIFTPNANENGQKSLAVHVQDVSPGSFAPSAYDSVFINVVPVDDAPVAVPDIREAIEDMPYTAYGMGVLSNDSDIEGDILTAVPVSGPAHGTVSLEPTGGFTYTPNLNFFGTDSFAYRAVDPSGLWSEATVTLVVHGMDDWIQLTGPAQQTTLEETSLTFSTANGNAITVIDPESPRIMVYLSALGTLTLASTDGLEFPYPEYTNNSSTIWFEADTPAEANAALNGLVYTPYTNFAQQDWFGVYVMDLTSPPDYVKDASIRIEIDVLPVNDAPVAVADSYELNEDTILTVSRPGVLGNDTDIDSSPLSAVLVSGPAHGIVTLNPNGGFTYTPHQNFAGQDSFTYRAMDAGGLGSEATVSLTVSGVNDHLQLSAPSTQATPEDTPLTFGSATGNAISIIDPDAPRIAVSLLLFDGGILTLQSTEGLEFPFPENMNNSYCITFFADNPGEANAALEGLVYTPAANQTGPVSLGITVLDLTPDSPWDEVSGYVTITLTPVNDAPVAVDDAYAVEAGEPFVATLGGGGNGLGVLFNDLDPDQDILSAILVTGPSHGTLGFNADGTFTYTAESTYSGTDSFTYRASDGLLESDPATVTFTVAPLNLPPIGVDDAYSVDEDGTLTVAAPGVLGNDSDPEGQPLSLGLVVGQAHGTLVLYPGGGFTYSPTANYHGSDEFWYRPFDGTKFGELTRVAFTVNPVNDAPVASANAYTLDEDTTLGVPAAGVLSNDSDLDGDVLSAAVVSGPSHGALTLNADGSFTYIPEANYNGSDSFTYRAVDTSGASSIANVSLTILPVAEQPVALDDAYSTTEDAPFSTIVAGTTTLTMVSDPGDYIGQGQTYNYSPATGTITIERNYDNGVSISYREPGFTHWWDFRFAAPDEGLLVPGLYSSAMRFPFQDPGHPGLDVSGDGRGSNTLTGWFRVNEVAYGPTGDVLVFSATFEQHSEGRVPALRGEIRYNAGGTAPGGVLLNDSDTEGDPLTAVLIAGPANGEVYLNPNGTFLYVPDANFVGMDSFRYKGTDGTSESNVATATITVSGVNDAPVNVVPGTQSLVEDNTLTFSTANGNAIRLTDVDAGNQLVELRLSVNGFLTFPTTTGLTFVTGVNGGNLIVVRGTLTDLNAALDGLVFRPGTNFTGNYSLQVRTSDLGNSGSGGVLTDLDFITLSISRLNDAPQNVVPLIDPVTPEDTPLTFNPVIWVTDVDQNDSGAFNLPVQVVVDFAAGIGTLTLSPTTGVTITGNGTNRLVLDGAINRINTALATLVFTPVANSNDDVSQVQLRITTDDRANGGPGALTDTDTFTVHVTPVNDAPTSTGLPGVSVAEDASPTFVTLTSYFSDIETGAAGLVYTVVTNTNPSLFSSVTASSGVLTLIYAPNANGSAILTVRATDPGGLSVDIPLVVTVAAVNDAPTSAGLPPVSLAEDVPPTSITLTDYFADIENGAAGLVYAVVGNTNPSLFSSISVSGGVLSLTYAPNANGNATLTIRATDAGGLTVDAPLAVTVSPVNDAPTSTSLPPISVAEDAPPTSVTLTNYFADIENGAAGLVYTVVGNTNPSLFSSVSVSGGVLTLNYASNANGSATVTVRATDSGGLMVDAPLAVTVSAVNDAPTFASGSNVTVSSGTGAQSIAGWASAMTRGPADEASQTLTFAVASDNPLLFSVQPAIDPVTGALTFTPITGAAGTATVTVMLRDDGGTANGGADTSALATFTITLTAPAGQAGVQVIGTELVITGASTNDTITISTISGGNGSNGAKVSGTINGQSINQTFRQSLTRIRASMGGGTDSVTIANGITLPSVVDGGAGTDTLKGGGGADLLFGGDGNDTINGNAGDDTIDAGAGNDSVTGGVGLDLLFGGTGDDDMQGGDGNDFLIGGLGADQLYGQNGFDILVGGSVVLREPSTDSLRQVLADWNPTTPGIFNALRARLNVTEDAVSADNLQGGAGTDWFLSADPLDTLDLETGELRN